MKVLLDTHTSLWFVTGSTNLSDNARKFIEDPANEMLLSIASLWEIAIKTSLGKVNLATSFADLIPAQLTLNGIAILDIKVDHLSKLTLLPFHHRDPFDRLIVCQALVEQIPLLCIDEVFDKYGVTRYW